MRCSKHPRYKGNRKPTNDCVECLELYLKLFKPRVLPRASKIIKSKKVYSRKRRSDGGANL
jgi:hypothetical protein